MTLWFLVPASALALGSIPVPFTCAAVFLSALVALGAGYGSSSRRGASLLPVVMLITLATYTAFQAIPLPLAVLAKIDPAAADIWARSLSPVRGQVTWGAVSLDPGSCTVEAAKWFAYACVFFAASSLVRSRGMRACLQIVVLSTVVVALVTVAHQLLEAKRVFGIYEPRALFTGRIGPLLNTNHLAGYLNLGALCAIGLAVSPRGESPRWLFTTAAIIDIAASLRAASRGGAAALLVSFLLLGALIAIPTNASHDKAGRSRRAWGLTMITATVAAGTALAALGFDRALWLELADTDTGKVRMAGWFKPMVSDFFVLGIGRGSFESVFEAYRPPVSGNTVFTHPENFAAQWVCEWGIVGMLGLLAFVWVFRPWRLGLLRSAKSAGAACGVVAILTQNLADFSLEVPAIAIAFSLVLGALWGNVKNRETSWTMGRFRMLPVGTAAALAIAMAALALIRGVPPLAAARDDVHRMVLAANQGKLSRAEAEKAITRNMQRFPAEFYFPLAGADLTFHAGGDPIPWIQRALERGPSIGLTHFILAEYLATRAARSQAFLELRLAADYEEFLAVPVAATALSWSSDFSELSRAIPDGLRGIPVLEAMALRTKDKELATKLDEEILSRDPRRRDPRARMLEAQLTALSANNCDDRPACEKAIVASSETLTQYFPQSSIGEQYLARLAIIDQDPKRALAILREGCLKMQDVGECLRLQVTVEEPDQLPHVLDRFLASNCRTNESCAGAYTWAAGFYASRGAWGQAYGAAEKAARRAPTEARWVYAADLAEKAGLRPEAVRALEQVTKYRGADPEIAKRIQAARELPP